MCLRLEKLSMAPPGWASGFTLWDGALCEAEESIRDQLDKKLEPGKGALREAEESIRAALCKAGGSIRGAVREAEKCIRGDFLIKHDSEDHLMDGICFLRSSYKRGKSSFNNVIRDLKANDEGEELSKGPNEADRNFAHKRETLISGVYSADASGESEAVKLKMEHCAKLSLGNNWKLEVKVCVQDSKINQKKKLWVDIKELYPDAIIEMSKNSTEVTLNSPKENHQFAVFGTPDTIDKKRMQLGLFGEKPVTGKNWKILSILFDDTVMAYQHVCKAEKARGRQLLTTLAGLFVSNSDQDIEINFRDVELGWKVKDGKPKFIRSKDAWNSPEDCTDFPRCFIEISHEDIKKRSFTFALIVSHEHDYAETEVIAYYEDPVKGKQGHIEQGQKP